MYLYIGRVIARRVGRRLLLAGPGPLAAVRLGLLGDVEGGVRGLALPHLRSGTVGSGYSMIRGHSCEFHAKKG